MILPAEENAEHSDLRRIVIHLEVEGTSKNVAIQPDTVRISGVGGDDRGW